MIVAKWLLFALLALPVAELVVFIVVTGQIGFAWAFALVLTTSFAGAMLLRHGGGLHVARMRVVMEAERISALRANGPGVAILLAGILLFIPGFITDAAALLVLIPPLRRWLGSLLRQTLERQAPTSDGIVDLDPEEWRRVPQQRLRDTGAPDGPR